VSPSATGAWITLVNNLKKSPVTPPSEFLNNTLRSIEIIHPDDILKVEKTIGLRPTLNHVERQLEMPLTTIRNSLFEVRR